MAKKIRLNVDELAVQSYATGEEPQPRGTVHGHAYWSDPRVCPHTEDWHCTVNEAFCTHPTYAVRTPWTTPATSSAPDRGCERVRGST